MITITIKDVSEYTENPTNSGFHVLEPTFIQFLQGLSQAMHEGFDQVFIYDTKGQFGTMPRWAMCEKIGELTGMTTALQGHDIVLM